MPGCAYSPVPYPSLGGGGGGPVTSFRTWDLLEAFLIPQPAGVTGTLLGATGRPILTAMSAGGGEIRVIGPVNFLEGDGSEFSLGLGQNIEAIGGSVLPTLDSSGLDVSLAEGVTRFNFLKLSGNNHNIQALYSCLIPTESVGQVVGIGDGEGAGAGDVYGGIQRNGGPPSWNRQSYRGAPPVALGAPAAGNAVLVPSGDQLVFAALQTATDVSNRIMFSGGGWDPTDPGTTGLQSTSSSLTLVDMSVPRFVQSLCIGLAAASFSAKIQKIDASGGLA